MKKIISKVTPFGLNLIISFSMDISFCLHFIIPRERSEMIESFGTLNRGDFMKKFGLIRYFITTNIVAMYCLYYNESEYQIKQIDSDSKYLPVFATICDYFAKCY